MALRAVGQPVAETAQDPVDWPSMISHREHAAEHRPLRLTDPVAGIAATISVDGLGVSVRRRRGLRASRVVVGAHPGDPVPTGRGWRHAPVITPPCLEAIRFASTPHDALA